MVSNVSFSNYDIFGYVRSQIIIIWLDFEKIFLFFLLKNQRDYQSSPVLLSFLSHCHALFLTIACNATANARRSLVVKYQREGLLLIVVASSLMVVPISRS